MAAGGLNGIDWNKRYDLLRVVAVVDSRGGGWYLRGCIRNLSRNLFEQVTKDFCWIPRHETDHCH